MKKAAHLTVSEVPYPFTSREQYERSLAQPLGKEWNAVRAARSLAQPELRVNAGAAIKPPKLPKNHGGAAQQQNGSRKKKQKGGGW